MSRILKHEDNEDTNEGELSLSGIKSLDFQKFDWRAELIE